MQRILQPFLSSILIPQLQACGLKPAQQAFIAEDVHRRLHSLLVHWHDATFRRTALLCGMEEAFFHEPAEADLEVRALAVVGVRNSLVEDLSTSAPSSAELKKAGRSLSDAEIPALLKKTVAYFEKTDLTQPHTEAPEPENDLFGSLAITYPKTWHVLSRLANADGAEVTCSPPENPAPALPVVEALGKRRAPLVAIVQSGVEPTFDPGLVNYLRQIGEKKTSVFFSDSFKAITRNPQKLFHVIEYVLAHRAAVVTHNYYLSPTYGTRRAPLLRPFHSLQEVTAKLNDQSGLSQRHRETLGAIKSSMVERRARAFQA